MQTQTTDTTSTFIDYLRREPMLYFSLIFLSIAVGVGFLGKFIWSERTEFVRNAVRTTGVVTSYKSRHDDEDGDSYAPIVRFTPEGGLNPITVTSRISQGHKPYRIGEQVAVLYLPNDPQHADLENAAQNPVGEIVCFALCATFGGSGLYAIASLFKGFYAQQKNKVNQRTA